MGDIEIKDSHTPEADLPHGTVLTLINISYLYVGFFYCIKNESMVTDQEIEDQSQIDRLKSDFQASEIYLYVNGGLKNNFF